ncbi:MAG: pyridoxamine 5'-phosphate oxidase family protein [Opitutaceae bacterium]|nr:pyridoxamine 5'-phosphate oxidase family protein [Opitutaceae bacterium]MBP9913004.1 pyridoxamine 5'-phosphate oxidase family protein [Opitutaceae bacterium]
MGKIFEEITTELGAWLQAQQMFVVATAPLGANGHVNCSPKGGDTFRILGPHEVAYADLTGSGIETVAHLRENGRIVLMFCAFTGAPKIVRLHGRGEVLEPGEAEFDALREKFPALVGLRTIIRIKVERVADSCGYAVPLYDFVQPRDVLDKLGEKLGPAGLADYRRRRNTASIDGLPGLRNAG